MDYFIANLSWIVPSTIAIIGAILTYYFQIRKVVKADLTITSVRLKSDTSKQRVYEIDFEINNSGNQTVTVKSASPFIRHIRDKNKPLMLLTASNMPEKFKDGAVEGGKIKSFTAPAYVDKSFIKAGINDQKIFSNNVKNLPVGKKVGVSLEIELGVRIYCADGRYRAATSASLGIIYSDGKQIQLREQLIPVSFGEVDKTDAMIWDFKEPV